MNDIDIEEGRRLAAASTVEPWEVQTHWDVMNGDQAGDRFKGPEDGAPFSLIRFLGASIEDTIAEVWGTEHDDSANAALIVWLRNNAAAMFDAIETGRQWETIARQMLSSVREHAELGCPDCEDALAAFRDVADRTPTPHHDGGVG